MSEASAAAAPIQTERNENDSRLTGTLRLYLFLLVFLAPIDYFKPTALALREAGARPSILFMSAGALVITYCKWRQLLFRAPAPWVKFARLHGWIAILGTFAFGVNLALGISYTNGSRSPIGQFVAQFALFALVPWIVICHACLLSKPGAVRYMMRSVVPVLMLHLCFIWAEGAGLTNSHSVPFSFFRAPVALEERKPSGLLTEPSYVGVLAGIYGLALVLLPDAGKRKTAIPVALAAVGTAMWLGGKTFVPVSMLGAAAYAYQRKISWKSPKVLSALTALAAVAIYNVVTFSALNVQENLSSAMRIGSTALALNVAKAGYGLIGVGFGQFHFMYREQFAPSYLFLSEEALAAFSRFADTRASTYNLFARYLVETGVVGLLLFLGVIRDLLRRGRRLDSPEKRFGLIMAMGATGFLMTQDPYFFPFFVLGASIVLAEPIEIL